MESEPHGHVPNIRKYNEKAVAQSVHDFLVAIGEDPNREGLRETPDRVAKAYKEIFAGLYDDPVKEIQKTFAVGYQDVVVVKDIEFYSVCEHHLLPFFGKAHVAYVPPKSGEVVGISKLARLVKGLSARPQVQEKINMQIVDALENILGARGVLVKLEAQHFCMSMRGVKNRDARTVTVLSRGALQNTELGQQAWQMLDD